MIYLFANASSVDSYENAPNSISAGSPQTPLGELTALPQTPQLDWGALLLKGGEGKETGGKGREGERREWEGKGKAHERPPPQYLEEVYAYVFVSLLNTYTMQYADCFWQLTFGPAKVNVLVTKVVVNIYQSVSQFE